MSAQGSNESVGWPYLKRIYARSFAQQPTGQAYCILRTGRTQGYLVSDGTLRDVIKNLPSRRSSGSSTRSDFAVMFAIMKIEITREPAGHGLPLFKCEAYGRIYDRLFGAH